MRHDALGALRKGFRPATTAAETEVETASPAQRERLRWRQVPAALRALISRNLLFSIALALAVVPRVIVMLAYLPAVLFRLDTFDYLWDATHVIPNPVNPSGYALFLTVLRPFHSLVLVAALQHVMGLAVAVMVYAVLRSLGVTRWLATLAACPVLFDPGQMLLEHLIMADIVGLFLMMAAFTLLLLRRSAPPSLWRLMAAGLLMGLSALVRPTTLPLILAMAVYLVATHVGWRKAGALLVAGALPVAGYMVWFSSVYGGFNLTNSNGLFLWSRTMSFANCATIKPPANLRALCPTAQPGPLSQPVTAKRPPPRNYLWDHDAWMWKPTSDDFVPDISAFTKANNSRALRFAIDAITAQPLSFAKTVAEGTVAPFSQTNDFRFPTTPIRTGMGPADRRYAQAAVRGYTDSSSVPFLGYHYSATEKQPYTHLIRDYQRIIFLPGWLFGIILLIGAVGFFIPRRRSAAAALLWLSAAISLVLPVAEHEYTYRYVIPAVPLACMAAALAFRHRDGEGQRQADSEDSAPSAADSEPEPEPEPEPA
jgi:hypothetical protein